jgi:hypothetical protein
MPFFGVPIRNGIPLGLGSVVGFGIAVAAAPPPPPNTFDVLPSSGAPTYTVTNDVPNSSGIVFAVLAAVLSSDGTSYSPI